jgi:hypothetical protein
MLGSDWAKSSYSFANGNCVEARASEDGGAQVRDTKDRDGGTLSFTGPEWEAFIAAAKAGAFGRPA